jgi:hypothetical protein
MSKGLAVPRQFFTLTINDFKVNPVDGPSLFSLNGKSLFIGQDSTHTGDPEVELQMAVSSEEIRRG